MEVHRRTVDLSAYPDLVVIYLGMQVHSLRGLKTLLGFGPKIAKSAADNPEGLLHHETFIWSLFPMHAGIRQYWRNFDCLELWSRSEPHKIWWRNFLRDSGGTGFWHETYFMRGGMEAVYDDLTSSLGLLAFAPAATPRGSMFTARLRSQMAGASTLPPAIPESELPDRRT
jgi:hypothetical protein